MINNTINIKFEKTIHTTFINIKFRQQKYQTRINPSKIHRTVFAEMLLIDSTIQMINNDDPVFTHPKNYYHRQLMINHSL